MDHSEHPRLLPDEMTDAVLTGSSARVVIDVGGFLGIGSKPVLVPVSDLDVMRDGDGVVHAVSRWTKDDLKALPEHRD
jgi:hypothetical protein